MILVTHGYVGATVYQIFSFSPPLGLALALSSHFVLDYLPHWDYRLQSLKKDSNGNLLLRQDKLYLILLDILKITFDFFSGLILVLLIWNYLNLPINYFLLTAVFLACLPDFNQLLNFIFNFRFLDKVSNFIKYPRVIINIFNSYHNFFHSNKKITSVFQGIFQQLLIIILALFLLILLI